MLKKSDNLRHILDAFTIKSKHHNVGGAKTMDSNEIILGAVKATASQVPILGPYFAELIGLAQSNVLNKRLQKWIDMIEAKLETLNGKINVLASDEFFVSVVQQATKCAMESYQDEKRRLFGNVISNAAHTTLAQDKQMMFIRLLNQNTLISIKLLSFLSEDHYNPDDYILRSGMLTTYIQPSQEKFLDYICQTDEDFSDHSYIRCLCNQLIDEGLIEEIDYSMPDHPKEIRKKRTTQLGDEFLHYIKD